MNSADVIQKAIMEFLTKEQFEKFCSYINKHERLEDTLSVKHFVNNSELYIKDSDIQDNWSFDALIKSIQFAIQ
jgi:hypothetical protein